MTPFIQVQSQDFDHATEYQALRQAGARNGAIATFTGLVRDHGDREGITGLFLEHYPGMTEKAIADLVTEAGNRWELQEARIIHRVGELKLGDQIVFVGVCSAHRSDAFAACQYLMDALKTSVPLWKQEITREGRQWVEQKASDRARSTSWES